MHRLSLGALTLAVIVVSLACSGLAFAAGAASAAVPPLSLPWGAWLIEGANVASACLVPIAGAFLLGLAQRLAAHAGRFAGPLQQLLTNALIDRMVRLAVDFALAAIEGAAKGKTLDVEVAPAVIALGAQRAVDSTLPWIVEKAGGPEGIAQRIFRSLDLDAAANANNVLAPALDALAASKAA